MFYNIFMGILLSFIIILLPLIFYNKKKELFQIESGFQLISKSSSKSFSINFFLVLIIFILFDLEIIFIFSLNYKLNIYMMYFILLFILVTLWIEWIFNKIKWIN